MKRSGPPQRKTRLVARTGLERRSSLERGAPRPRSKQRTAVKARNDWPAKVRAAARARSGGRCEIVADGCFGEAVQLHHRKLREHGDHRLVNAVAVCAPCHDLIHKGLHRGNGPGGIDATSYDLGWLVRSFDDPAVVPWWRRRREWVAGDLPSRAPR